MRYRLLRHTRSLSASANLLARRVQQGMEFLRLPVQPLRFFREYRECILLRFFCVFYRQ